MLIDTTNTWSIQLRFAYYLMFPGETYGVGSSGDVTIEVNIDSFADVLADQIATQFQTNSWRIYLQNNLQKMRI